MGGREGWSRKRIGSQITTGANTPVPFFPPFYPVPYTAGPLSTNVTKLPSLTREDTRGYASAAEPLWPVALKRRAESQECGGGK